MWYAQVLLVGIVFIFLSPNESFPSSKNTFNQLVLAKGSLESKLGVRSVECFPFKKDIGFTEDQILLIERCLAGLRLLESAFDQVSEHAIHTVGVSTRFLRTGGFNTVLIPWNASIQKTISFLENKTSKKQQKNFLNKILTLKRKIDKKFRVSSLYCSQRISNEQCMVMYERLALIERPQNAKPTLWKELILDDRQGLGKDSHSYSIKYGATPKEILQILNKDPQEEWSTRKKMYDYIKLNYKRAFERRLQIATYFCSVEITEKNCLDGMASLSRASESQNMRMKAWGEVVIDKYNTFVKDDFDVSIRYDLPTNELINYFSSKDNRVEATENAVLAEKLEKRTLNNSSGLRAVCDLEGMRSKLCTEAFNNFIKFVSGRRDYRVKEPWTNLMFIDGTQLARVNFALNSSARHSYIYVDAGSGLKELRDHLVRFEK